MNAAETCGQADHSGDNSSEMIANWIDEINQLALFDFQMLSELLKDYARLLKMDFNSAASEGVSGAIAVLQRIDIFSQKLMHMKMLQNLTGGEARSTSDFDWHRYMTFVLRLNYFQAEVASLEFDEIVSSTRANMNKLYSLILRSSKVNFSAGSYFAHHHLIVGKLTLLKSVLLDLVARYAYPKMVVESPPEERLSEIERIYSNQSERFVLSWLIGNTHGTSADLLSRYSDRYQTEISETEGVVLF